jgi:hypothetical protein
LAPQEGHIAAKYLLGAEIAGLLWYLVYLRPRLADNRVGVYREASAGPRGVKAQDVSGLAPSPSS